MSTVTASKIVAALRATADRLKAEIDKLNAPRQENTPKRARQGMGRRIEAAHLARARTAYVKLADAHERGELPPRIIAITEMITKGAMLTMLRTKTGSNGYYDVHDTGVYSDMGEAAIAFRAWLDGEKDSLDKIGDADRVRAAKVADLEAKVRFAAIPGFFPTPVKMIDKMVEFADVRAGMRTLEPSAGKGDIAAALDATGADVVCYEINDSLRDLIAVRLPGVKMGTDFLAARPSLEEYEQFDRVVMNPPFERGADIDHVMHAFAFLKRGGRLVAVMSAGPFFRTDAKSVAFRAWLKAVHGEEYELPADVFTGIDAFRETGTKTMLVIVDR